MSPPGLLEIAFALCAGTLLLMIAPGFWLYRGVLKDLRERHPAAWAELGSPTVVYYSSQEARRALGRFLSGEEAVAALGDAEFSRSVRRYQGYLRVYGAVFVGLWILFAAIVASRLLASH